MENVRHLEIWEKCDNLNSGAKRLMDDFLFFVKCCLENCPKIFKSDQILSKSRLETIVENMNINGND